MRQRMGKIAWSFRSAPHPRPVGASLAGTCVPEEIGENIIIKDASPVKGERRLTGTDFVHSSILSTSCQQQPARVCRPAAEHRRIERFEQNAVVDGCKHNHLSTEIDHLEYLADVSGFARPSRKGRF